MSKFKKLCNSVILNYSFTIEPDHGADRAEGSKTKRGEGTLLITINPYNNINPYNKNPINPVGAKFEKLVGA